MSFEELKKIQAERRKYWDDLKRNDPKEYERQRAELEPLYDRWQAETDAMAGDEENESPD
jgi:hypothetical protein